MAATSDTGGVDRRSAVVLAITQYLMNQVKSNTSAAHMPDLCLSQHNPFSLLSYPLLARSSCRDPIILPLLDCAIRLR